MGLFSPSTVSQINAIAAKSKELVPQEKPVSTSVTDTINAMSQEVMDYFKDSPAKPVTTVEDLHDYVSACIEYGYAGIDTETTGLDRIRDYVVGWSLYTPGHPEIYVPCKHRMPIFESLYPNQLTYEQCQSELQRLVDNKVRLIFANADFDIAMIYKDFNVDTKDVCYYDCILAWRCLKENEKDNTLKGLYAKYVMKEKIIPKKFTDFFTPSLFPYCKPEIAALYAANDAKITFELFKWQLPFVTKDSEKCKKHHLEKIADLVWNIEFPMIRVCAMLHRRGVYLDNTIIEPLHIRYTKKLEDIRKELADTVQQLIEEKDVAVNRKRPFRTGTDFNSNSNPHVLYLLKNLLGLDVSSTGKEVLNGVDHPVAKIILDERQMVKLLGTYIDKMPNIAASDNRVHCSFKSIGAATGRMCLAKGTKVSVLDGTKNIEDIVPGDKVYCLDENRIPVLRTVFHKWQTGKQKKCVTVMYVDSFTDQIRYVTCTPEHPIALEDGSYMKAADLSVGQRLLPCSYYSPTLKHQYAEVISVTKATQTYDVYDIEVEEFHHFVANGIVVHNSSESPNMQNIPSKLHDIRHMFRATPEIEEQISLDQDNMITLFAIDKIEVKGKGLTYAKDVQTDDIVEMSDGSEKAEFRILQINIDESANTVILEFSLVT